VYTWTVEDVQNWLESNFSLFEVARKFEELHINGARLVEEVDEHFLLNMGVDRAIVSEILREIQSLQGDNITMPDTKLRLDEVQNLLQPRTPIEHRQPPPPPSDLEKKFSKRFKEITKLQKELLRQCSRNPIVQALADEDARTFWFQYFGDQPFVNAWQFIQTMIETSNLKSNCFDLTARHTELIYTLLQDLVDPEQSGTVSVEAFSQLLDLFGPIDVCMKRICKSLVDLSHSAPSIFPWFFLRPITLKDLKELQAQGEGTFLLTCSIKSASFTLSVVITNDEDQIQVVHQSIRNTTHGFRMLNNDDETSNYSTIAELVQNNSSLLSKPYFPAHQPIELNVSGTRFLIDTKCLMKHEKSKLAKLTRKNLYRSHILRINCDVGCFSIISNFLRFDEVFLSKETPIRLLIKEATHLGYNVLVASLQQHNRTQTKQKSPPPKKKRIRKEEVSIEKQPFFHGDIDRKAAERRTIDAVGCKDPRYLEGRFLVRSGPEGSSSGRVYILSYFLPGDPSMKHTRILKKGGKYGFYSDGNLVNPCDTFDELLAAYIPSAKHPVCVPGLQV